MKKEYVSLLVFALLAVSGCSVTSDADRGGSAGSAGVQALYLNNTGGDYNWSVDTNQIGSGKITVKFVPVNACQYAILHYSINNGGQQNVQMSKQGDGSYSYEMNGYPSGGVVIFNFTYEKTGCQYDTSVVSYPDIFGISCKMREEVSKYGPPYVCINFSSSKTNFDSVVMHYQIDEEAYTSTGLSMAAASNYTGNIALSSTRSKIGYSFTYTINGQVYNSQTQFYYAYATPHGLSYQIIKIAEGAPAHLWIGFKTTNLNLDSVKFCYTKDGGSEVCAGMIKQSDSSFICNVPGLGSSLEYRFEYTSGGTTYQTLENFYGYDRDIITYIQ